MFELEVREFSVAYGRNREKSSAMWETVTIFIYMQVLGFFREQTLVEQKLFSIKFKIKIDYFCFHFLFIYFSVEQ